MLLKAIDILSPWRLGSEEFDHITRIPRVGLPSFLPLFIYLLKTGLFRENHKGNSKTATCNLKKKKRKKVRFYSVVQASLLA